MLGRVARLRERADRRRGPYRWEVGRTGSSGVRSSENETELRLFNPWCHESFGGLVSIRGSSLVVTE